MAEQHSRRSRNTAASAVLNSVAGARLWAASEGAGGLATGWAPAVMRKQELLRPHEHSMAAGLTLKILHAVDLCAF